MSRRKKPGWIAATSYKLIKLPPNGPRDGQSVDAWLYGKEKGSHELMDDPRQRFNDLP